MPQPWDFQEVYGRLFDFAGGVEGLKGRALLLIAEQGQVTPYHFHWAKMEEEVPVPDS